MRTINQFALTFCLGLAVLGCGGDNKKNFDGPTVDAFHGKVTYNGSPVTFAENEAQLKLFHEKGQQFGIPLQPDGTFVIGWMPTGKYAIRFERTKQDPAKRGPQKTMYNVPDGLTIEDGKTDYVIELGKDFKP